jgi:hypothetical protein
MTDGPALSRGLCAFGELEWRISAGIVFCGHMWHAYRAYLGPNLTVGARSTFLRNIVQKVSDKCPGVKVGRWIQPHPRAIGTVVEP